MAPRRCLSRWRRFYPELRTLDGRSEQSRTDVPRGGETLLCALARRGDVRALWRLLRRGWDPDCCNLDGQTALALAAARGHLRAVELLLEHGADPGAHGLDAASPLIAAAANGHLRVVEVLLEAGAPIDQCSNRAGLTALMAAAGTGRRQIVDLLVARGASLSACDARGRTAFHHAAFCLHLPTLESLWEFGADPQAQDHQGRTALAQLVAGETKHDAYRSGYHTGQVMDFLLAISESNRQAEELRLACDAAQRHDLASKLAS